MVKYWTQEFSKGDALVLILKFAKQLLMQLSGKVEIIEMAKVPFTVMYFCNRVATIFLLKC